MDLGILSVGLLLVKSFRHTWMYSTIVPSTWLVPADLLYQLYRHVLGDRSQRISIKDSSIERARKEDLMVDPSIIYQKPLLSLTAALQ